MERKPHVRGRLCHFTSLHLGTQAGGGKHALLFSFWGGSHVWLPS